MIFEPQNCAFYPCLSTYNFKSIEPIDFKFCPAYNFVVIVGLPFKDWVVIFHVIDMQSFRFERRASVTLVNQVSQSFDRCYPVQFYEIFFRNRCYSSWCKNFPQVQCNATSRTTTNGENMFPRAETSQKLRVLYTDAM